MKPIAAGVVVLGLVVTLAVVSRDRGGGGGNAGFGASSGSGGSGAKVHPLKKMANRITPQEFPERPALAEYKPGVKRAVIQLKGQGPGGDMTMYLYLPAGDRAAASLPCVVIAPAGTTLLTGIGLEDGDVPEHLPYVQAGFAVLAYSLDGDKNAEGFKEAMGEFKAAAGGVVNAMTAVDYLEKRVPEVDLKRVYAAGHSSAAAMALTAAACDDRIKGVCAYAPCVDVKAFHGSRLRLMDRLMPGVSDLAEVVSIGRYPQLMKVPVMLFYAENDEKPTICEGVEAFAKAIRSEGGDVTVSKVPSGGHYDSMMREGIPRGIHFLTEHCGALGSMKKNAAGGVTAAGAATK